jgi:hypothetical protein
MCFRKAHPNAAIDCYTDTEASTAVPFSAAKKKP